MAILGSGKYRYEVSGDNFGSLPEGWVYREGTACAVDSKDNVYVFNRGGHPVIVFDGEGKFLHSWGDGIFSSPHGITIGPDDSVYCVDNGDHTIRKFTLDGELLMTIGEKDKSSPRMSGKPFNLPTHLAVDPRNGDLYIADGYGNARVHKYTENGEYVTSWGESGTDDGQFNIVHNIGMSSDGRIYIGDRENHRVQVFDADGNHQATWGNMSMAAAICVDYRGTGLVYVGEYFAGISSNNIGKRLGPRVSIYDLEGKLLERLSEESYGDEPGRFYSPHGIDVDSKGNIYVADVSYSEYGRLLEPPRELRSMQKLVKI